MKVRRRRKKPYLEILKDLHVLGFSEYKNVVSGMPSVCLSVWMYASAAPEGLGGFRSYSVFKSLCVMGRCPANINILSQKLWTLRMGHKNELEIFWKSALMIPINFQQFVKTTSLNEITWVVVLGK
jgi:hypothetical protein